MARTKGRRQAAAMRKRQPTSATGWTKASASLTMMKVAPQTRVA